MSFLPRVEIATSYEAPTSSSLAYFDYAATTPVDPHVITAMVECLGKEGNYGNPASSSHTFGKSARLAVEKARAQVASLVGADANDLVWTSGATESNNLALKGVACGLADGKRHIISSRLEHKAVLDTLQHLETAGFLVTYLTPDDHGNIPLRSVREALRQDTFLVSLMLVNNEIGTVTDIHAIGHVVREHGALFHVDAAQATGKLDINLASLAVDMMSFSAHKTYGPKGIGALFVGPRARQGLSAQMHGGGHEHGFRSGTLATHQIVGMGEAFEIAGKVRDSENLRIEKLRDRFVTRLEAFDIKVNGGSGLQIPHTVSFTPPHDLRLNEHIAVSSTSACNSSRDQASHVLLAIGLDDGQARRTVRLSFGRFTTEREVDLAIDLVSEALEAGPDPAPLFSLTH